MFQINGPDADIKRLFISGLSVYFLAIIYNYYLANKSPVKKHLFNLTNGLSIAYFNFGLDTIHSLVTCISVWSSIHILGPDNIYMVVTNLIFCMGYLMYGYYEKERDQLNQFTWTLPQCVLTLSLIALSFDLYDGHQRAKSNNRSSNDDDDDENVLDRIPTFLELLSKVYFPPTFLIGPQIQFKHYLRFIESKKNYSCLCWKPAILRFFSGFLFLAVFKWGQIHWPISYFLTEDFKSRSYFMKWTIIMISTKLLVYRHIGGWLIAEGACIMYGISRDPNSNLDTRCCNISLLHYETTPTFRGLIESFNMTTNHFALVYIYKRLKFLGSKFLSHLLTLTFLALWHGFSSGYYMTFAMEMFIIKVENDMAAKVIEYRTKTEWFNEIMNRTWFRWLIYILMRLHVLYMLSYCLVPFFLLDHRKWIPVLGQLYFLGHIIYIALFLILIFYFKKIG